MPSSDKVLTQNKSRKLHQVTGRGDNCSNGWRTSTAKRVAQRYGATVGVDTLRI